MVQSESLKYNQFTTKKCYYIACVISKLHINNSSTIHNIIHNNNFLSLGNLGLRNE